ncbi:MAG TPA: hypothetical protein PKY16_01185 [Gemmiger qucibialis]|nr:hypothetical protein [Gemmiger qucibialis]
MLASVLHTVIIYAVVIFAMRLMGKRQLGELQPSELVTTFMISNVASICIDEPDLPLLSSLVPILLIAALEILNSDPAGCTAASAHDAGRSDGSAARQGYF